MQGRYFSRTQVRLSCINRSTVRPWMHSNVHSHTSPNFSPRSAHIDRPSVHRYQQSLAATIGWYASTSRHCPKNTAPQDHYRTNYRYSKFNGSKQHYCWPNRFLPCSGFFAGNINVVRGDRQRPLHYMARIDVGTRTQVSAEWIWSNGQRTPSSTTFESSFHQEIVQYKRGAKCSS